MRLVLTLLALLALPTIARAQPPVLNPTKVEVTASPDHNVTALGAAIVSSYRLTYKDGTTTLTVQDAGKPSPTSGKFEVAIPAAVLAVKNKALTVTVEIVGPGGTEADPTSGPFGSLGPPRASGTAPLPKP